MLKHSTGKKKSKKTIMYGVLVVIFIWIFFAYKGVSIKSTPIVEVIQIFEK